MPKSAQERAEIRRQTEANRQADKDRSLHTSGRGQKVEGSSRNPASKTSLSRHDLDDDQFDGAIKEFNSGSDRVAAIMGTALLENNLIDAIKSCLNDSSNEAGLFHEVTAPFATFRAKITTGRALGLYNKQVEDDLNRIRKIRNEFAHALLSISFENNTITNLCNGMGEYVYHVDGKRENVSAARVKFERACWTIALGLMMRTNDNLEQKHKSINSLLANALSDVWNIPDLNSLVAARIKRATNNIEGQV